MQRRYAAAGGFKLKRLTSFGFIPLLFALAACGSSYTTQYNLHRAEHAPRAAMRILLLSKISKAVITNVRLYVRNAKRCRR